MIALMSAAIHSSKSRTVCLIVSAGFAAPCVGIEACARNALIAVCSSERDLRLDTNPTKSPTSG